MNNDNRKRMIRRYSRKLQVSKAEAEKFLDEIADGLNKFKEEKKNEVKLNIIGLEDFGKKKKM